MAEIYEKLTFNVGGKHTRHETLDGVDYLVAPTAMMTEGVHTGSSGPILYTKEDLQKSATAWNHKPIVAEHPEINGQPVSACDPVILESRRIGMVLNTVWKNKLRTESWFDYQKTKKVDARIIDAIEKGKMVEVSTGLYTDNEKVKGEFNGKKYDCIARNHRPDHLAVLVDKIGACSIADGAGLLQVNEAMEDEVYSCNQQVRRKLIESLVQLDMVDNELSHSSIRKGISQAMSEKYPSSSGGMDGYGPSYEGYIADVYSDSFIHEKPDGTLHRYEYATEGDKVKLKGDPEEVKRVTEYRKASDGSYVGNAAVREKIVHNQEKNMMKVERITALIANGGWEESDRPTLEAMPDAKIEKLYSKLPTTPVVNQTPPVVIVPTPAPTPGQPTVEQYINNAPPQVRDALSSMMLTHNAQKEAVIKEIMENPSNPFQVEFLNNKSLPELQGIATLARRATPDSTNGGMFKAQTYVGQGGQGIQNASAQQRQPLKKDQILVPPTMTFTK